MTGRKIGGGIFLPDLDENCTHCSLTWRKLNDLTAAQRGRPCDGHRTQHGRTVCESHAGLIYTRVWLQVTPVWTGGHQFHNLEPTPSPVTPPSQSNTGWPHGRTVDSYKRLTRCFFCSTFFFFFSHFQLKRQPNVFSWHAGNSCVKLGGNDDGNELRGRADAREWGTCHWCPQPRLPLQVPICSSTGPSAADKCHSEREGCWGVKEAINIPSPQVPLLSTWLSLSLLASICPSSLVLLIYQHLNLVQGRLSLMAEKKYAWMVFNQPFSSLFPSKTHPSNFFPPL